VWNFNLDNNGNFGAPTVNNPSITVSSGFPASRLLLNTTPKSSFPCAAGAPISLPLTVTGTTCAPNAGGCAGIDLQSTIPLTQVAGFSTSRNTSPILIPRGGTQQTTV